VKVQIYTLVCQFTVELPSSGLLRSNGNQEMDPQPIHNRVERMVERISEDVQMEDRAVVALLGPAERTQTCTIVVNLVLDVTKEPVKDLVEGGEMSKFLEESIDDMCRRLEDDVPLHTVSSDVIVMPPIKKQEG